MKKLLALAAILVLLPFTANAFPDDFEVRSIFGGQVIVTANPTTPDTIDLGAQTSWVNMCAQSATGNSIFVRASTIADSLDYQLLAATAENTAFKDTSFTLAPLTATGGQGCTGWFPLRTRVLWVLSSNAATLDIMALPRR